MTQHDEEPGRAPPEAVGNGLGQGNPNGTGGDAGGEALVRTPLRPRIGELVTQRSLEELRELHRFWSGQTPAGPGTGNGNGKPPPLRQDEEARMRREVLLWMADPEVIDLRLSGLGRRLGQILALHLDAGGYQCSFEELAANKQLAYLTPYDLEAGLAVLQRHGLLVERADRRFKSFGARAFAVPVEIGDGYLRQQRARRRGIFDVLTLRGFLDRQYDDPSCQRRIAPTRLREMYKMYSNEPAAVARIERLPEDLRRLVEKAILQFGGILPRGLFERMESEAPAWEATRWRQALEESLLGTVERLDLARYGIQLADEVLLVFNEVALAWLRRVAVPGDPDQPHSEASLGVDLVSNISRFMGFILEHNVRFTVRGEIFKTTEKRILQELIPNPGRELSREAVLDYIYAFARAHGLIESTGERTFALGGQGRSWEQKSLEQKLTALLEHSIEERSLGGDHYHQLRLRRIFLRLLKRVEPGTWYDLMYLPFLARNTYLSSLDQLAVEEYFTSRNSGGHYAPMEDPQRMAWNLTRWLRQRLYLLGIVDLGYDASNRPVALRLTRPGARLLGVVDSGAPLSSGLGCLIVTPDFEVVLFPTGDDAELVHELDRFCVREKGRETLHFRILDRSVHRALAEGVTLQRILETLRGHSRTPVPQNVLYSVRDWAYRAGLILLDDKHVARCEDPETLRRFLADPGVRPHLREALDERRAQLKSRYAPRRLVALLRELGYLVEFD